VARATFREIRGVPQPAPAPRFSGTPLPEPAPPEHAGERATHVLEEWGLSHDEVAGLVDADVLV
jgi:alpha-methylacyl-CoA racemase